MSKAIITGQYDPTLVAVSVVIAFCASYVALDLAARTTAARGKIQLAWLSGGAFAMGTGIWAMHYIGMLAFHLPLPVYYHVPTVGLSWLAAVFASAVALFVVSRKHLRVVNLSWGSLIMGGGICAMHYTGMAAMRLPAHIQYQWKIVGASVLIAVLVAGAALFIAFRLRDYSSQAYSIRAGSAIIMGLAICAMHYTGMAAACFHHHAVPQNATRSVTISSLGVIGIAAITFLILVVALCGAIADRHFSLQQELLDASQREYRLLVEHNLAAVCRTAIDGRVLDANQICIKLFGYNSLPQMIGANIADHYANTEQRTRIIQQLQLHRTLSGVEVCFKKVDGSPFWVIYNLTLVESAENGSPEIIATALDISATKHAQQELLAAKEQAEAAVVAKSQFLTNMSHELRTPLNGILGMTTLALDSQVSNEVRDYLEVTKASAETLLGIVDNILEFSTLGAQKVVLDQSRFDLPGLCHDALRTVSNAALEKGLQVITHLSPRLPQSVIGDGERLREILLNLLGNAIKFTHEGSITLTAEAKGQGRLIDLRICVRDTGIGIPEDQLSTIFDAFTQVDCSSTRQFGGTGLGLAICKRLVGAMGGILWAESEVARGSAFHLAVPLSLPAQPIEREAELKQRSI